MPPDSEPQAKCKKCPDPFGHCSACDLVVGQNEFVISVVNAFRSVQEELRLMRLKLDKVLYSQGREVPINRQEKI